MPSLRNPSRLRLSFCWTTMALFQCSIGILIRLDVFGRGRVIFMPCDCQDIKMAGIVSLLTPVNTFRVILNTYFGADLPLLEDKSCFMF